MASRFKDERLINKVDELAASLHATSDVLTTADNMLEHYRGLNREQDMEIARLNDELHTSRRPPVSRRSRRSNTRTSSMSDPENRRTRFDKVAFTDEDSNSEIEEFESALRDLNKKQHRLERELKKNKRKGSEEIRSFADSLRKDADENVLEKKLKEIQQQLEIDRIKKVYKDDNVERLADEIRQIRGMVQLKELREPLAPRQDSSARSFVEEVRNDKVRNLRDKETISELHGQLLQREEDQEKLLSQLRKTRGELEESDSNQKRLAKKLESLEDNFEKEKSEKRKLEDELSSFRSHTNKLTRENADIISQLQYLRDQNRSNPQISDFQKRLDDLERGREKTTDRQNPYREDSDRKDALIEKMTSQIRELSAHVEKAESEKRRYRDELEDSMKKLRNSSVDLQDIKSLLREKEDELRDSEEKRQELKSRALEAIKEYRSKCRDLEKEKARLEEREELKEKELLQLKTQNSEFERESKKSERDIKNSEDKMKQLESEVQQLQTQVSQLMYEKAQLEEGLTQSISTKKDVAKMQHEYQDLSARNAAISGQLVEETEKRRALEERLAEVHEKQTIAREEATNLYQQLQEERLSHAKAMRKMDEELNSISTNEDRNFKELTEKANQEKTRYEDEIRNLQNQVIEERSLAKANQTSREECEKEILALNSDNNRLVEENRRIRKKYLVMKKDFEEKLRRSENETQQYKERIAELEAELRNNQENLLQTREASKQSLREIHSLVDSLLDELMQEAKQTSPIKSLSESIPIDPKKWSMEILDKLNNCRNLLKTITDRNAKQASQFTKAQEKIQELLKDCDKDKNYFLGELEKQNEIIESLKRERKGFEKSYKEKTKTINSLQERTNELTNHLEQCTRVLNATLNAMEERKTVLADLEFLENEQLEKQRIHEEFIRHTEKLESLQDQLEDAKNVLHGVKDDNLDNTMFNVKFLKSLSPAPKRRIENKKSRNPHRERKENSNSDIFKDRGILLGLSDVEDERPPPKKSKEVFPMSMSDREFNDSFVPKRE